MDDNMRAPLVVDALNMAVARRRPPEGQTVHHSDHGGQYVSLALGQYVSLALGQAAHDAGIAQSMGAVGTCFDKGEPVQALRFINNTFGELEEEEHQPGRDAAEVELE